MKITYDKILSWSPCHSPEKCLELLKGQKEYELFEFLELDSVSANDKLWVVLRRDVLPDRTLHDFAIWCAESVLHIFEKKYPNDHRPRLAIEAKKKWLNGEITNNELATAQTASAAAATSAYAAAADASVASAAAAASAAATTSAYAAADAASAYATAAAAYATHAAASAYAYAYAAEQLKQLKKMI